jgi:hypothetical protein
MVESREYILKRLDTWYADRFRKHYTSEISEKSFQLMHQSMVKEKNGKGLETLLFIEELGLWSPENQITYAESYFSQAYATMEHLIEEGRKGKNILGMVQPGVREEYIDPMMDQFKLMQKFVEGMREVANKHMEREISDHEINESFIKVFGGKKGFNRFYNQYTKAVTYFMELAVGKGDISRDISEKIVHFCEASKESSDYLTDVIFPDIQEGI